MLAFEKQGDQFRDGLSGAIPYLIEKKARLTGDSLQDARVQIDPPEKYALRQSRL